MKSDAAANLTNLPPQFKTMFLQTLHRLRTFGQAIILTEFAFLQVAIAFRTEFPDEEQQAQAESFRRLVHEAFDPGAEFFDKYIEEIGEKQDEFLQGFYAQGLIFLWTSLETLVKQVITGLIELEPSILATDSLAKIKIPMAEFFGLLAQLEK